jgi:hypothetical protein
MVSVKSLGAAALVASIVLFTAPLHAQDAPAPAAPVTPAEPALPEPEPAHLQAAIDFLVVSGATKGFAEMIPQFLDQIRARFVSQRPEIAQVINDTSFSLIADFVTRRDDLNRELGKLYASKFTKEELEELTAFYKSPLGQKLAVEQVKVLSESVPIVQRWSRTVGEDMTNRIKEEVGKLGHKL